MYSTALSVIIHWSHHVPSARFCCGHPRHTYRNYARTPKTLRSQFMPPYSSCFHGQNKISMINLILCSRPPQSFPFMADDATWTPCLRKMRINNDTPTPVYLSGLQQPLEEYRVSEYYHQNSPEPPRILLPNISFVIEASPSQTQCYYDNLPSNGAHDRLWAPTLHAKGTTSTKIPYEISDNENSILSLTPHQHILSFRKPKKMTRYSYR